MSLPEDSRSAKSSILRLRREAWEQTARERLMFEAICERDYHYRKDVIDMCRVDPVYFINHFGWTFDPRNSAMGLPNSVPFVLYPRQVELIRWALEMLDDETNGFVPKCRGVGASWVFMALACWFLMFRPGWKSTFGTMTAGDLDELDNPDSLFEKARFFLRRLPRWFLEEVAPDFNVETNSKFKFIGNPNNGSTITGEVGDSMGRSGRASMYVWDESAHATHAVQKLRAIQETTECVFQLSTPKGMDNQFATSVHTMPPRQVFYMRWDSVPYRNEAWLEKRRREKFAGDPIGFAQEVMVDFLNSSEDVLIPAVWVLSAVDYDIPGGELVSCGYDVALGGDESVMCPRVGPVVLPIETWEPPKGSKSSAWSTNEVLKRVAQNGGDVLAYDAIGVGEGVSGSLASMPRARLQVLGFENLRTIAVTVSRRPTKKRWLAGQLSTDAFTNLRAELWWWVRERFRKTYENRTQGASHPLDECISIPNDNKLIQQLSWPLDERKNKGKRHVESKKEMKKRRQSSESPDRADALVNSFADDLITSSGEFRMGWA